MKTTYAFKGARRGCGPSPAAVRPDFNAPVDASKTLDAAHAALPVVPLHAIVAGTIQTFADGARLREPLVAIVISRSSGRTLRPARGVVLAGSSGFASDLLRADLLALVAACSGYAQREAQEADRGSPHYRG